MEIIGLQIEDNVATSLGYIANSFIQVQNVNNLKAVEDGNSIRVSFPLYKSYAKYADGDSPLVTAGWSQVRNVIVPEGTEVSMTSVHEALKALLEEEGLTVISIEKPV